jgi:hypothetical protein
MSTGLRRTWLLIGVDGRPYDSDRPGTLGGHRGSRIDGRLDCRTARAALARGGYVANRVFFDDEQTAIAVGYRPCAVCMRPEHARWKAIPTKSP